MERKLIAATLGLAGVGALVLVLIYTAFQLHPLFGVVIMAIIAILAAIIIGDD